MKAVFIDVIVNFKFQVSATSTELFCIVFSYSVDFLQGDFCLPVFLLTITGAISSISFLIFELKESRRRSTESAEMLGVKDIAFINSILVFSLMHLFLTETDLDSVVAEINISKKIQKWSGSATSLTTMDEMFRPLLMSISRVCPRLCVGPCTCWIRSKVFKTVIIYFVVLISVLSMWILKSPAIAKQSNYEEIIDNISVNSSKKAGEYFGGL